MKLVNIINKYSEDLDQISRMLKSKKKPQDLMLMKVESAITQAHFFEKTILHLIKERKFMG